MEMAWRELSGGAEANGSRPVRMLRSCLNGRQDELSPLGCLPERTQGGPQVHLFSAYVTKSAAEPHWGAATLLQPAATRRPMYVNKQGERVGRHHNSAIRKLEAAGGTNQVRILSG